MDHRSVVQRLLFLLVPLTAALARGNIGKMNSAKGTTGNSPDDRGPGGSNGEASSADNTDRMRTALAAVAGGAGSLDELQIAARALVTDLRARSEPPEQVLVQIKRILSEAGLRPAFYGETGEETPNSTTTVYRDVIAWSIRSYYEDDPGSGGHSTDRA
jgi:hypothetical protein